MWRSLARAVSEFAEVVRQQDVDPRAAEPGQALLVRAEHGIAGVVEDRLERIGVDEPVPLARARRALARAGARLWWR